MKVLRQGGQAQGRFGSGASRAQGGKKFTGNVHALALLVDLLARELEEDIEEGKSYTKKLTCWYILLVVGGYRGPPFTVAKGKR